MKVNVNLRVPALIDLTYGDQVIILKGYKKGKVLTVKKLMENSTGVKVIFNDGSWRPLNTFGFTWEKVVK